MYTVFGGQLRGGIDLTIDGCLPITEDAFRNNLDHSARLGLKGIEPQSAIGRSLAVIGGGPSIRDHADEIRNWDGDVWAINGAFGWCRELGLDPTFISVDPHPIVAKWARGGSKALLASQCAPEAFEVLKDADVQLFSLGDYIKCGSSTVSAVPHLAAIMGYDSVTLFGCEASFPPGKTHAYQNEERDDLLLILCNGELHLSCSDFYLTAIEMGTFLRELPGFIRERCGGLTAAMAKTDKFQIVWVCDALARRLKPRTVPAELSPDPAYEYAA